MSLTEASDKAFERSQPPVRCRYLGGPQDGETTEVSLHQHTSGDYFRVTTGTGGKLRSYFIWRQLPMGELQERLTTEDAAVVS